MSVCHPSWRDRAACRGMGPSLFFPEAGGSTREAIAVCEACPVKEDCLREATGPQPERFGVWGGTSEATRRKMRPRRPPGRPKVYLFNQNAPFAGLVLELDKLMWEAS